MTTDTDSVREYHDNEIWMCKGCGYSWGCGSIPGGPLVTREVDSCWMCPPYISAAELFNLRPTKAAIALIEAAKC